MYWVPAFAGDESGKLLDSCIVIPAQAGIQGFQCIGCGLRRRRIRETLDSCIVMPAQAGIQDFQYFGCRLSSETNQGNA